MRLSSVTTLLPAVATLIGTAAAQVEIRFYYNTWGCGGTGSWYDYWWNIPAYTCWNPAPGSSHGAQFFNVPGGALGQTYQWTGCSTWSQTGGSGTYCLDARFVESANWFWASKKFAKRSEDEEGPSSTGVQYTTPEGVSRRIAVAQDGFTHVHELLNAGDWAALAEYPDGKSPALTLIPTAFSDRGVLLDTISTELE